MAPRAPAPPRPEDLREEYCHPAPIEMVQAAFENEPLLAAYRIPSRMLVDALKCDQQSPNLPYNLTLVAQKYSCI